MIVLVQASYFLYSLVIDINSLLTSGIINLVDSNFFLLTADNITNLGLQLFFGLIYGLTLLITIVMLSIRYIIVSVGVVFIPLGIFFFFIPPLKDYGKLIFNFLGICIFTTFIDSLIFLAGSKLSGLDVWQDFKILVMISSFGIANLAMLYFILFSAIKSALSAGDKISGTIVSVAKYFA